MAESQVKINRLWGSPLKSLDKNMRVLIKKGPTSVSVTSLKELEENCASKPEWKVIEEGGVLTIQQVIASFTSSSTKKQG